MKIIYYPNKGFQIQSLNIEWDNSREAVRERFNMQHNSDDRTIEMSQYFGGDTSHDIEQRRDIYQDLNGERNKFILNYDNEDRLAELEVHSNIEISVKNVDLLFGMDIHKVAKKVEELGEKHSELEEGSFLFENLKMTIASSQSQGGEGNGLAYFYAGKSIKHLLD